MYGGNWSYFVTVANIDHILIIITIFLILNFLYNLLEFYLIIKKSHETLKEALLTLL